MWLRSRVSRHPEWYAIDYSSESNPSRTVVYAGFFNGGGSVKSHRDDVKYSVILRHHDVASLAVSI